MVQESEETIKARHILVKALKSQCFNVEEEKIINCTDGEGRTIRPPYQADIYASIHFIIELDPESTHGGDHQTKKDNNRSNNIFEQYGIRTIRLQPADVLKDRRLELTYKEMLSQLKEYD